MSQNKVVVGHQELSRFIREALAAKGARAEDAAIVADGLVWANLRGVDGHGVSRLPFYLRMIERGEIDVTARPLLAQDRAATFVMDGGHGFGPVAMMGAIAIAAERAAKAGVCFGLVRETTHTGAIGRYVQWMAQRGCAAMIMGAGPAFVAYHGARVASLGTSPIAIAVPSGDGAIVLDMATSAISNGTILQARATGASLPPNSALTKEGEPTTDPAAPNSAAARRRQGLRPRLHVRDAGERAGGGADPGARAGAGAAEARARRTARSSPSMSKPSGRLRISRRTPIRLRRSSNRCRGKRASTRSCCPASAPAAPKRSAASPAFRYRQSCGRSWR